MEIGKYRKAKKRIKEAGIVKFYYDRKVLASDVGSIGEFVGSATQNVTYVGCWLSSSLKQDLVKVVLKKARDGVCFTFCLHAPRTGAIEEYASFFNSDNVSISTQIEDSIVALYQLRSRLDEKYRQNIRIFWHSEMITTSFWLIDSDTSNAKIQLDFKIVKSSSRWFSFGMEIIESSSELFENIKNSYLSVIEECQAVDEDFIDEINGIRKRIEEQKKEIIKRFPFEPKNPFVFISYSHKNILTVLNDLLRLKSQVNCWVDFESLDGGRNKDENDWTMKVKPVLESPNCVGVISYVSEAGFASSGFINECDWIKNRRPDFFCFLVDFSKGTTASEMLKKIRGFSEAGEDECKKQIRDEALTYITQATSPGKESYYHVESDCRHLETTDFQNWIQKVFDLGIHHR